MSNSRGSFRASRDWNAFCWGFRVLAVVFVFCGSLGIAAPVYGGSGLVERSSGGVEVQRGVESYINASLQPRDHDHDDDSSDSDSDSDSPKPKSHADAHVTAGIAAGSIVGAVVLIAILMYLYRIFWQKGLLLKIPSVPPTPASSRPGTSIPPSRSGRPKSRGITSSAGITPLSPRPPPMSHTRRSNEYAHLDLDFDLDIDRPEVKVLEKPQLLMGSDWAVAGDMDMGYWSRGITSSGSGMSEASSGRHSFRPGRGVYELPCIPPIDGPLWEVGDDDELEDNEEIVLEEEGQKGKERERVV